MGSIRHTKAIRSILQLFDETKKAISVVELVKKLAHTMNKTTVYRALERLEQDGTLHSFKGTKGLLWYAKCSGCTSTSHGDLHPHFQCSECGTMQCLDVEIEVPKIPKIEIANAELILTGQCSQCLN